VIVRQATLDDIGSLIDNCAAMHRDSAYSFLPFDREKVAREISACLTNPAAQCGFVAEDENRIVGMLGGYVGEYFFCTETVATDMVFFWIRSIGAAWPRGY